MPIVAPTLAINTTKIETRSKIVIEIIVIIVLIATGCVTDYIILLSIVHSRWCRQLLFWIYMICFIWIVLRPGTSLHSLLIDIACIVCASMLFSVSCAFSQTVFEAESFVRMCCSYLFSLLLNELIAIIEIKWLIAMLIELIHVLLLIILHQ